MLAIPQLKLTPRFAWQIVVLPVLLAGCARHDPGKESRTAALPVSSHEPVKPSNSPDTPIPYTVTRASESASHESLGKLQFIGRIASMPSGEVRYSWSGSGFRVRFQGRGLNVDMADNAGFHTVVLDGTLRPSLDTQPGARRYRVAENLAPGEHLLEVYRRTEPLVGATTLSAVEAVDGQLLDISRPKARQIEIIGDSITCGYGNVGSDTSCHFSARTENHYLSYGALLARHFGAELSTIAWSGRGVVRNYNGEKGDCMPELYRRILPEKPEVTAGKRPPPADLVIVNLGTNDFSTEPDPARSVFVNAYVELLAEVRHQAPSALILATIGPMLGGSDLGRAELGIREAVENRVKAGDSRVVFHKMRTPNTAPGCDWHPNLATHEQMAKELEEPISRVLKW